MDQKKTLWIIAAVGAFLLVVLSAAIIMYSQPTSSPAVVARYSPNKKQMYTEAPYSQKMEVETFRPDSNGAQQYLPEPKISEKVNELYVISDNTSVYGQTVSNEASTTIDLNALKNSLSAENQVTAAQPQNINITVNIPESKTPDTKVVTNEYYKETVKEVPVVTEKVIPVPMPKPVFEKSEPVKVKQGKPAASKTEVTKKASPAKVSSPVKTTVEAKNVVTQYWVQVAAYSNKKGAENARTILDENKINSDIFTYKDNKDKLFYRVRVGPYTTKSEAEYWRTRIVKIDDFAKANSYVTSTTN